MKLKLLILLFIGVIPLSAGVLYEERLLTDVNPEYRPFKKGEFLRFNIHYGIIDAGEATFSVKDTDVVIAGNKHYSVKVTGRSYRSWDYFFKVRDYYYSYIDSSTMMPTVYSRNVLEGDYKNSESYYFDRKKAEARGRSMGADTSVSIPFNVQDLASMIYFARSFKFYEREVGTKLPINVFFDSEWYECGATLVGYENVKTKLGTFKCMKIVPELVSGRVFKGQRDMVVYVSADKNQIPVRVESEIFIGSIKVDLIEFKNVSYPLSSKID